MRLSAEESMFRWTEALLRAQLISPNENLKKLELLLPALFESGVIHRNLQADEQDGGPDFHGHPFDLDGLRTPETIISEGTGGSCGSHGKVLAHALLLTGSRESDVYLVDTVGESERPNMRESTAVCGHQFLLVMHGADWYLVNSTNPDLEKRRFVSPKELLEELAAPDYFKAPQRVVPCESDFASLLNGPPRHIFGNLVIFLVAKANEYPNHDIRGRLEMVRNAALRG